GYQYEHAFSFNWNAMKGFHLLMRIGHLINVLAQYSHLLKSLWEKKGARAFIKFLDEIFRTINLNLEWIRESLTKKYQIRFG
ncbi:MAG: DDE transposase family protein, partial [bacterium]